MNFTGKIANSSLKTALFFLFSFSSFTSYAQDYWTKVPTFASQCYSENDSFVKQIFELRSEVKKKLEASSKSAEEKASRMTNEEKMAMATRYQNMKPDEIVKFQTEMLELTRIQTEFQQLSADYETRYNDLEENFRAEFARRLGPIESEYNQLPDGEGTPQWAIRKGQELTVKYNIEYESLCNRYITSPDSEFQVWLKDFKKFLHDYEVPYNQQMIKSQYAQFGIEPDKSAASLMALERYLVKCEQICNLRRPHRQG